MRTIIATIIAAATVGLCSVAVVHTLARIAEVGI